VENYIIKLRKQLEHHNHIDYSQLFLRLPTTQFQFEGISELIGQSIPLPVPL